MAVLLSRCVCFARPNLPRGVAHTSRSIDLRDPIHDQNGLVLKRVMLSCHDGILPRPDAHRTKTAIAASPGEEFYEVTPSPFEISALNRAFEAWEHTYNTVSSCQTLGDLTLAEFPAQTRLHRREPVHQESAGRVQLPRLDCSKEYNASPEADG